MMTEGRLSAKTTISIASPLAVMARLREHFVEHGMVHGIDERWSAEFPIGTVEAATAGDTLTFRVAAGDETSLAFLQWGVTEHVGEFAVGTVPPIIWNGGTRAGSPLPYFREMRVVGSRQITPRMRRVTLAGEALGRFAHDGMHIRLLLAPERGVTPVQPVMAEDGRLAWPNGPRPISRVYTIRRIDAEQGVIEIDFVLHEGEAMPGAAFAVEALPGDTVGMTGPGGAELREADLVLLLGDETALPAIARMLEEMPAGRRVKAMIEVADRAERQHIETQAEADIVWLSREGRPAGTTSLLADAIRSETIPEDGRTTFIWAGCEREAARAIRTNLRKERGMERRSHLVAAYWRRGVSGEIDEHE